MRIVDVSNDGCLLTKDRGFLKELTSGAKTPLEDIDGILISAHAGSIGFGLMRWAADAGVPVVICDAKYLPSGMLLPMAASVAHPSVLADQIAASEPRKKRFWASVVKAKITLQAQALRLYGEDDHPVQKWLTSVRSGDPDNREASAAAAYFSRMFGSVFRRGRESAVNRHLDYGYAVARAATARAAVSVGLHPALSIHHSSTRNTFALIDDLMEPFRAVIDVGVRGHDCQVDNLAPNCKRAIIAHLTQLIKINDDRVTVIGAMRTVCSAWRSCLRGEDTLCPSITFDEKLWPPNDTGICG